MLHVISELQCIPIDSHKDYILREPTKIHVFVLLLIVCLLDKVSAQELISQSPNLIKSVLTQTGSSTVSYDYINAYGVLITTNIKQSIGQNGVVGLSKTSTGSVQQGFLNYIKTIKVDNPTESFSTSKSCSFSRCKS